MMAHLIFPNFQTSVWIGVVPTCTTEKGVTVSDRGLDVGLTEWAEKRNIWIESGWFFNLRGKPSILTFFFFFGTMRGDILSIRKFVD